MRRLVAVLALISLVVGCVGCGDSSANRDLYSISYYDETDTDIGYNGELFYVNDSKYGGADPSVAYGKSSDGEEYFYVFPTSTNVDFFAYRSKDMANWQGIGTVFTPESKSWVHSSMWAPDVVYDADADDGQGGKGLYYFFFTGANDYLSKYYDSAYFDSRDIQSAYLEKRTEIYSMTDTDAADLIARKNGESVEQKAVELAEKYNVPESSDISNAISFYEANIFNESDQKVIGQYAKEALLKISASNVNKLYGTNLAGCIATAKTLDGPFVQYTNDGSNGERVLTIEDPFFSHEDIYEALLNNGYDVAQGLPIVDLMPFVDKNGDKYIYFNTKPLSPSDISAHMEIYVIKVGDKNSRWTDDWEWDTITQLTRTGYVDMGNGEPKVSDQKSDIPENYLNEGAYVIYNENNGKYYLTMSFGHYNKRDYSVVQAIGDSPMGPFKKVSRADGGIVVQAEATWPDIAGPGHHSFMEYDGKIYMVYHKHMNSTYYNGSRVLAMDEVKFVKNGKGEEVLYLNGPTLSEQPLVGLETQYRNIAQESEVTAVSGKKKYSSSETAALNDGLLSVSSEVDFIKEFTVNGGKRTTITLNFDDYRTVRAIMIYNSRLYEKAFDNIRRIEMDFKGEKDGKVVEATAYIDNLKFNSDKYIYDLYGYNYIQPGAAAVAEFAELEVKTIRIILDTDKEVNISEIYVLGK